MKLKNKTFYSLLAVFTVLSIALDQLTKWLTIKHIPLHSDGGSVLGLFDLTHTKNTGAAWSMMEGQTWLFVLVLVVFLALLALCVWKKWINQRFEMICLAAIAGGGIGNGIDRIFRGGEVTDMIQFSFWKSFPTFNVADCFITLGCIALAMCVIFFDKKTEDG